MASWGCVLGLLLFIFISNLEDGIECKVFILTDDIKFGRFAGALEERIRIQNDSDKLEKWSKMYQTKLDKVK